VIDEGARGWRGTVVLFAANPWDGPKLADQHIAEGLAQYAPVLYVDPAMSRVMGLRSPQLAARLAEPRLRMLADGIARLTPVVLPGPERPGIARATRAQLRHKVRKAIADLGGSVHAVIDSGTIVRELDAFRGVKRIFWAQDDYVGGAALFGQDPRRIAKGEARQAANADVIVSSSPTVADLWRSRGYQPELIPYGCDATAYRHVDDVEAAADVTLPSPIVGFVGFLNDRIDLSILDEIAARGRSLLLVGAVPASFPVERLDALLAKPNVQWVGFKEFGELPAYLRCIDVGIVPYTQSAFNKGSFPLKTLEYLAAGRAAVATDLPATRWLDTDLIRIESMPVRFADAVDAALREPRSCELVARRQTFARMHTWTERARRFAQVLDLDTPAREDEVAEP